MSVGMNAGMGAQPRRFHQVDVFSAVPLQGNPLAVVHAAQGLDDTRMAAIARWTNLSETTFLLPPTDPAADYRVRIFTPFGELPFAGHPTLGSAWAWLAAGGVPRDAGVLVRDAGVLVRDAGVLVQQCAVGLVRVKREGTRLAFAAPPQRRSEPLDDAVQARICAALGLAAGEIQRHRWIDNGPGWCGVQLASGARVRELQVNWPLLGDLKLGVVGLQPAGEQTAIEVRAFVGPGGFEDPVTGSLNASVAQWLIGDGVLPPRYVAAQGHALQRAGRVHVAQDGDTIWVGGDVTPVVEGIVSV